MFGDSVQSVEGSCNLAADGCGCVCVISQVGGHEDGIFEGFGVEEAVEGGFEAIDDVAGAFDCFWRFLEKSFLGKRVDQRFLALVVLHALENFVLCFGLEGFHLVESEEPAGFDAQGVVMGGSGGFLCHQQAEFGFLVIEHHDGTQAHDGAIAGCLGLVFLAEGVAGLFEAFDCTNGSGSDVEALAIGAPVSFSEPLHVVFHLVCRMEALFLNKTFG